MFLVLPYILSFSFNIEIIHVFGVFRVFGVFFLVPLVACLRQGCDAVMWQVQLKVHRVKREIESVNFIYIPYILILSLSFVKLSSLFFVSVCVISTL